MNTTPTPSHPDVIDATQVLQGLMQLAFRRMIASEGKPQAEALLSAVEAGKQHLSCTVEIKRYKACVHVSAIEGERIKPLLNFEIDQLDLASDVPSGASRH